MICFLSPGRDARPSRVGRQRLAFHQQRQFVERRAGFHFCVVKHQRAAADFAARGDFDGAHFHYAILEQMRLDGAIGVQHGFVADGGEIKFAEVRGVHINAPPDLRAEQAEIPADERRAGQHAEQPRVRQMFVQRVDEFVAPDERTPERFFA